MCPNGTVGPFTSQVEAAYRRKMSPVHPNPRKQEGEFPYAPFWAEELSLAPFDEEVLDAPFDLDLEQRSVLEAEVLLWRIRLSRTREA